MRQLESFDVAPACGPRSRTAFLAASITLALACGLTPVSAEAQSGASGGRATGLEEIIVTARKRDEDIQTVPQSIDVLGGGELASLGKVTFKDLQFEVPGFYIENYESRATIAMRGVGSQVPGKGEAIATHLNGIFQASTATSLSWLFDVERVEVLKGPQGTLYGRNSTGGAVNMITRRPGEEFDGGVKLEYGSDQTVRASVGVDVPLNEDWSVRLAGTATRADGRLT
ncbi:MAG: TonB-dependent receptor, partial [Gammaproteobacteria bacterium]